MTNSKTLFLDTFTTHLHTIQNLNGLWHFVLEFYPPESSGTKNVMIASQVTFSEYEYAIEEAIDALEAIGFILSGKTLVSVYVFDDLNKGYNKKIVEFDGENFKTIDEMFMDFQTFFDLMEYGSIFGGEDDEPKLLH